MGDCDDSRQLKLGQLCVNNFTASLFSLELLPQGSAVSWGAKSIEPLILSTSHPLRFPSNRLYVRPHRYEMHLGMYASVTKGYCLCGISLLERVPIASERRWRWSCSRTYGNWNSRLYVVSFPILVRLRKPWKGHS